MIMVSVPGKVHLMGEHAVVYGKPALLAAVNKRLTVSVTAGNGNATHYVADILRIVQSHFGVAGNIQITIKSDIPVGYHLGSSAAVAVGTVAALSYFYKKIWNPQLFNQLAYEAEKIAHGNPSGADNTTVTMGGFIWYRKELEFLKSIWQLPLKTKLSKFYLVDTGKPAESTKDMVAYVAAHRKQSLFDQNEEQTKRVAVALKTDDKNLLIDAIRKGGRTLEAMGVVSEKAKKIIRKIESSGGAAKILGGGGRKAGVGYLLCYSHKPPEGAMPIALGEEGVRLESRV